ncbi:Biopolymer transport protein ExbD [Neorhodopirellula lusitana]|uniref:Biopolymer transport protein ExbD n=1 Tax=Neorhodopirellula lusitana TaxID=445327 RepID=A0ABY1Q3A0_9BACT|nr:biopolymer transporter ExbD [Neorhodopirellula lusitana]SMP56523.1 Biopolymer transport protein ExbD [Neorhodopirellula lusitana]
MMPLPSQANGDVPPRAKRDNGELDMTPMVDVTFLLLIFFMVTASFSLQRSIAMPRQMSDQPSPNPSVEPNVELESIQLEIDDEGAFLVLTPDWEREPTGKQNLVAALKEAVAASHDNLKLDIRVHENAQLQRLVDGMDAGTITGFQAIQITEVNGFD